MNFFRQLRTLMPVVLKSGGDPVIKRLMVAAGYYRFRTRLASKGTFVRDLDLYRPLYSPWDGDPRFLNYYDEVRKHTLVDRQRCWILLQFMRQALALPGCFAEFGVFRGGTALLAAQILRDGKDGRALHLFDSFAGMPKTSEGEAFDAGDFSQTSEARVRALIEPVRSNTVIHAGYIPQTFAGLEIEHLAFAHVDVDLYQSVLDCVQFIYPRLVPGGIVVFDDYGFPSCTRAREATDNAFAKLPEKPIYLPTGQAVVIKLPAASAA
jgi:hypothetical protein